VRLFILIGTMSSMTRVAPGVVISCLVFFFKIVTSGVNLEFRISQLEIGLNEGNAQNSGEGPS